MDTHVLAVVQLANLVDYLQSVHEEAKKQQQLLNDDDDIDIGGDSAESVLKLVLTAISPLTMNSKAACESVTSRTFGALYHAKFLLYSIHPPC